MSSVLSSNAGSQALQLKPSTPLLFLRFWIYLVATVALIQPSVQAVEQTEPTLVPNIFAPESTPAHAITDLAVFVLVITAAIFVVVAGLLTYAIIRFRRRASDDEAEPAQIYGSGLIEGAWTTVPFLIVIVLALSTARVIQAVQDAREPLASVHVQVIGHQWWWEFRYPKLGIATANELHVPVNQATFLELRSADVIHSFWVPRLAGKTDLIPNKENLMWIEPERTGLFVGQCAKYCGTEHALMLLRVYVDTREDFDRWLKHQQERAADNPAVAVGKEVFERTACINCHSVNGTVATGRFGPDLTHLMSRDTLGSGAVNNSPENLRAWIKSPGQFKPGVFMPAMNLNDNDLNQLVSYLTTLK